MNHIIEQQKERARDEFERRLSPKKPKGGKIRSVSFTEQGYQTLLETLDTIITETHQATIAEVVRIAEGMKLIPNPNKLIPRDIASHNVGYNHACEDFIRAITSNKE
jgi:hypothetical protein